MAHQFINNFLEQFSLSVKHRKQYPNILRYWYGQEPAVSLYKAEYVEVFLFNIN